MPNTQALQRWLHHLSAAHPRESTHVWLVVGFCITLSYALNSPTLALQALNGGLALGVALLWLAHRQRWLNNVHATAACAALMAVDVVFSIAWSGGLSQLHVLWSLSVALPALAVFGPRLFAVFTGMTAATMAGLFWAEMQGWLDTRFRGLDDPAWWWQTILWLSMLFLIIPFLLYRHQRMRLHHQHVQSMALEQAQAKLERQTQRQHAFLSQVARALRAPLMAEWSSQQRDAPHRHSAWAAQLEDTYVDIANLEDSGALDSPLPAPHEARLSPRAWLAGFERHPPVQGPAAWRLEWQDSPPESVWMDPTRWAQLVGNFLCVGAACTHDLQVEATCPRDALRLRASGRATASVAALAEALSGRAAPAMGWEALYTKARVSQHLASAMGGEFTLVAGDTTWTLTLHLPAPPTALAPAPLGVEVLAISPPEGTAAHPVLEGLREHTGNPHRWRSHDAAQPPEHAADVAVVMIDDWEPLAQDLHRVLERLRPQVKQVWAVTLGATPRQREQWAAAGVERTWQAPIHAQAWREALAQVHTPEQRPAC